MIRFPSPSRSRRWAAWLLPIAVLVALPAADATAADNPPPVRRNSPHAGFAYPGGGQTGTTFIVNVGGQFLRQTEAVHISGGGVRAEVVVYIPTPRNLDGKQRRLLARLIGEQRDRLQPTTPRATRGRDRGRNKPPRQKKKKADKDEEEVKLPQHPLLENMESKSLDDLREIAFYFFRRRQQLQRKRAIEETVKVRITIAPDAEPGVRDLRVQTRSGITNPIRFYVGMLPEAREQEPYPQTATAVTPVTLPVTVNGQILPRDADRFQFEATQGQQLVFRSEVRGLVPYQADSVPGWMQTTLALYDEDGREVAYADEYHFDPDPVLVYTVPEDGEYILEVRDAISRGRDDFVYRVSMGEIPFIHRVFPLGGRANELTRATIDGYNLGWRRVPLDTRAEQAGIRETSWRHGPGHTNEVTYDVDTLPEQIETEPNDDPTSAPVVEQGRIINGRIDRPGDVDIYPFQGRGSHEFVAEVRARQLGSPMDSLLRLVDAKGEVLAWNDDHVPEGLRVRAVGMQTHHADSYLRAKLPKSGTYYLHVSDVAHLGGEDYAYRVRMGPPRPDVELFVVPSSINIPAGRASLISVCAIRKDGFEGDIDVALLDAPPGFELGGGRIPSGQTRVEMTLTAPKQGGKKPHRLDLVGRFTANREEFERPIRPADDIMQAFLWRHILPVQELAVVVLGSGRWVPVASLEGDDPVRVPRGGKAKVRFAVRGRVQLKDIVLEAVSPPKGISLGKLKATHDGFTLEVKASRQAERTGVVGNLIVEAFIVREGRGRGGKDVKVKRSFSLGYLPAIPFKVVRR